MDRPTSVTRAVRLIWLLVLLALLVTVLAVVFDDELVEAWAGGQRLAADDTRIAPSFSPVVIVLFVVVSSLVLVLMSFLMGAHNWARHCLAVGIVAIALATAAGIVAAPPVPFVICCVASLVIDAAILRYLYHRDTTTFLTQDVVRAEV